MHLLSVLPSFSAKDLQNINISSFAFVKSNEVIETAGTTGNAKGKAPHLHYTIKSMISRGKSIRPFGVGKNVLHQFHYSTNPAVE